MTVICVISYKGGVGKTTTAIHIAEFMQSQGRTILADGDNVRASVKWSKRGNGFGFKAVPIAQLAMHVRDYEHVVIDTEASPSDRDFKDAAEGCDLLVIPAEPGLTATDGLRHTLEKLKETKQRNFKVLLTKVPPAPQIEGKKLYKDLVAEKIPVFKTYIPYLVAYRKASDEGVAVGNLKGDRNAGRAWRAYQKVGREIIDD